MPSAIDYPPRPTAEIELELLASGYACVAGVDEVGRGSLAGPVVAAAVVLSPDILRHPEPLAEVRDSKQLTPAARSRLSEVVRRHALAIGLGMVSSDSIDTLGIVPCTRRAMLRAIRRLSIPPGFVVIDYLDLPELDIPQRGIVDGDSLCLSIAAASIVAKTARDALMEQQELVYDGYGFANHKGYGTAAHIAALQYLGPCPIHRRSFAPVQACLSLPDGEYIEVRSAGQFNDAPDATEE